MGMCCEKNTLIGWRNVRNTYEVEGSRCGTFFETQRIVSRKLAQGRRKFGGRKKQHHQNITVYAIAGDCNNTTKIQQCSLIAIAIRGRLQLDKALSCLLRSDCVSLPAETSLSSSFITTCQSYTKIVIFVYVTLTLTLGWIEWRGPTVWRRIFTCHWRLNRVTWSCSLR